MINHKKGLSPIIITLMLMALALFVVGIVWYIVNNIVSKYYFKIYKEKCYNETETIHICDNPIKQFKCGSYFVEVLQ